MAHCRCELASNREIEGYASAANVARGSSINLYVQTSGADASCTIQIYRVGWYGGVGGRPMAGPITRSRVAQPACPTIDAATRIVVCNWTDPYVLIYDSDSIGMNPAAEVSLTRPDPNAQRHMNGYGAGDFFAWEINTLRSLEGEGYDVQYSTNIDIHTSPSRLLGRSALLSVGHDAYYTRDMNDAVAAARNAGVNLGVFDANNIWWQIRWSRAARDNQPHHRWLQVRRRFRSGPDAATGSMNRNWGLDSFTPRADNGKVDQHNDRSHPAVQQVTRDESARFTTVNGKRCADDHVHADHCDDAWRGLQLRRQRQKAPTAIRRPTR